MPHSVFAPYTSITTNILFFDNTHPTEETWVYRMDMPVGYKNFSKTKPILLDHFKPVVEWWNNREEITIDEFPKAKKYSKKEIEELYKVTVLDVNTVRYAGKRQSRYTRAGLLRGQKNAYKKAIVTLKAGDEIDFYSNI